jgi:flagellar biosynthesis protein FlhF
MSMGGSLYNVLSQAGLPVSYLSAGQRVPEDLEIATRDRLVEFVWGKLYNQVVQANAPLAEVVRS